MKRTTAIALIAMANFALAGTSFAQSNGVRATVPFDFTVGSKLLPSGTYTIQKQSTNGNVIVIRSHDKPIATLSLVNQDSNKSPNGKAAVPQVRRSVLPERDSLRPGGHERRTSSLKDGEESSAPAGNA